MKIRRMGSNISMPIAVLIFFGWTCTAFDAHAGAESVPPTASTLDAGAPPLEVLNADEQSTDAETSFGGSAADDQISALSEVERNWNQALANHVAIHWLRPPRLPRGLAAQLRVKLLPDGNVVSVDVISSSGNLKFDNSLLNAVLKASPLPLPTDQRAFRDTIEPTFAPE